MPLAEVWEFLQSRVLSSSGNAGFFNPYNGVDPHLDLPGADQARRSNLCAYLESFDQRPTALLIGEAPGWRGCRFSGVPFTSEAQLAAGVLPFQGRQTSQRKAPYAEATATIFWNVMTAHHPHFIAWNCVPFHPHHAGLPLSNRAPTRQETLNYLPLLEALVGLLQPRQVIAVGRSAERALAMIGLTPLAVHHPAHGGAAEFRRGIEAIFRDGGAKSAKKHTQTGY